MLAIVFLHPGTIQHVFLHIVAKRTFVHLEENQDPFFTLLARVGQFFLVVAPGLMEEMLVRITGFRDGRRYRHEDQSQKREKGCQFSHDYTIVLQL